jgi:hypothetical protein
MVMPDEDVHRVSLPEGRSRALAAGAVGSFWILPLVSPLLLRPFMTGRPFALHYFRYALIVQGVFVLGFALSGLETLLRGQAEWSTLVALPAWLWALYGSIVGLVATLSGERRSLRPIPRSWLWAPGER